MNKIIGLLTAWGAEDWIRPAVEQALEYCDEVMCAVLSFHPAFRRFEDGTYDICKEYRNVNLLDYGAGKGQNYLQVRANVLNSMLKNSKLFLPGNWIWMLDVDEFYLDSGCEKVKSVIAEGKYDKVLVESKFFMIDTCHYLKEASVRVHRIVDIRDRYTWSNRWSRALHKVYTLPRDNGMFHYSMLTNTDMHFVRWQIGNFPHKSRWLKEIYSKYDLADEDYWIEKNKVLTGIRTPWCDDGYKPDKNGRLFQYEGVHPKFIEKVDFTEIEDFRVFNQKEKT